jgi:predicted enzyme related to lactoylglutathione lyase
VQEKIKICRILFIRNCWIKFLKGNVIILTESSKLLQINKIEQISIGVKDLEKAIEFYRNKLELDLNFTASNMAFFNCSGITVMLGVPEKEEFDHPSSVLYFEVKDIEESFQLLKERGVKLRGKPHIVYTTNTMEKWMLFFEDSDNNVLALTSNVMLNK